MERRQGAQMSATTDALTVLSRVRIARNAQPSFRHGAAAVSGMLIIM